jgi:hypothetical protein
MKKTVKKLDNNVIRALTVACESAKEKVPGFEWLTHSASYDRFPGSLVVTCVFDNNDSYNSACEEKLDLYLCSLIQKQLLKVGIVLKTSRNLVQFDNEQDCLRDHDGDWQRRLQ